MICLQRIGSRFGVLGFFLRRTGLLLGMGIGGLLGGLIPFTFTAHGAPVDTAETAPHLKVRSLEVVDNQGRPVAYLTSRGGAVGSFPIFTLSSWKGKNQAQVSFEFLSQMPIPPSWEDKKLPPLGPALVLLQHGSGAGDKPSAIVLGFGPYSKTSKVHPLLYSKTGKVHPLLIFLDGQSGKSYRLGIENGRVHVVTSSSFLSPEDLGVIDSFMQGMKERTLSRPSRRLGRNEEKGAQPPENRKIFWGLRYRP
ncbi:hypothetical protein CTKA_02284 [Chthonomonas calidirosea]|uniref:Uncharacterized protein n=1 Tax=Chthonomonas calidirosea (strain DSM 23976 / ICMP 18418 / T49) TaxID=1303518 RepID=S0EW11_CHTCT|nr:hypothetical protein [Chthonomonas calidirosea]CCW35622.1 hypothetical protein CCALI_01810 [Chthonomonas calidirosea T49]CEK19724.1 hypothetical protein CTKA_02284 [Chthonomonas calidirosea]